MYALKLYMIVGVLWAGAGVMLGYLRLTTITPLLALVIVAAGWPYFVWRILKNILAGDPNGPIWP